MKKENRGRPEIRKIRQRQWFDAGNQRKLDVPDRRAGQVRQVAARRTVVSGMAAAMLCGLRMLLLVRRRTGRDKNRARRAAEIIIMME
jgi:anti-sigma factor RsiW